MVSYYVDELLKIRRKKRQKNLNTAHIGLEDYVYQNHKSHSEEDT